MIPLVGFLPANDPRVRRHGGGDREELTTDGFVAAVRLGGRRRRRRAAGREGAFLACSFWLADNLHSSAGTTTPSRSSSGCSALRKRRRPAVRGVRPDREAPRRQLSAGVLARLARQHDSRPLAARPRLSHGGPTARQATDEGAGAGIRARSRPERPAIGGRGRPGPIAAGGRCRKERKRRHESRDGHPGTAGPQRSRRSRAAAATGPSWSRRSAVGVCGTDVEISRASTAGRRLATSGSCSVTSRSAGSPGPRRGPGGRRRETSWSGIVRRPDPVPCNSCARGEWDICRNGQYVEHGIKALDGFMRERYRAQPDNLVRVDAESRAPRRAARAHERRRQGVGAGRAGRGTGPTGSRGRSSSPAPARSACSQRSSGSSAGSRFTSSTR